MKINEKLNKAAVQPKHRASGFSIIELMIALAVLMIVVAVITDGIIQLQKRSNAENAKVDITQESREFVDQLTRDIHQAGFPNYRMSNSGSVSNAVTNTALAQSSIISATPALSNCSSTTTNCDLRQIEFEGDMDGSGAVTQVYLKLIAGSDGNCPCTLERGTVPKVTGGAPTYYTQLNNVINSGEVNGAPYSISGFMPNGTTYDNKFASYKSAPVFRLVDQNGNPWVYNSGIAPIIRITVNVLAQDPDQQTNVPAVVSMSAMARMNN